MLYLDANVFIYAALNLEEIQRGRLSAASSTLTFDELVWAVKRYRGIEDAINAGGAFVNMPGLKLVAVTGDLLSTALDLIRQYQLHPRDSIHAASALLENAEAIISTDEDFDGLKEIRRRAI